MEYVVGALDVIALGREDSPPVIKRDLASLGLTIHSHLRAFHASGCGELMVCFDSLPALVDAVSLRRAFRFLHILTTLIETGATAHFHFDSSLATSDFETLCVLFDGQLNTYSSRDPRMWTIESTPILPADT